MNQEPRAEYLTIADVTGSSVTIESRTNRSGPSPFSPGVLRQIVTNNAPLPNAVNLIVNVLSVRMLSFSLNLPLHLADFCFFTSRDSSFCILP